MSNSLISKSFLIYDLLSLHVFGSVEARIDFEQIDLVELILTKSELNAKWFMFGYI